MGSAGKSEQEVGDAGMGRAMAKEGVGGNTKFKEREILVQHVLVPEDQLELLLDVQRKVIQGLSLSFPLSLSHTHTSTDDNDETWEQL